MTKVSRSFLDRQRDVLQKHHGEDRDRTQMAAAISVSVDQYKRYLAGTTMLRPDLVAPLARAFGVDPTQLAAELGIIEAVDRDPVLAELLAALGMTDDEIRQLETSLEPPPTPDERREIARFAADIVRKRTTQAEQRRRRA